MIFVAVFLTVPANALPAFGVKPAAKIATLQVLKKISATVWRIAPPEPNPAFKEYTVVATPGAGVCQVEAVTPPLANGAAVAAVYGQLRTALSALYGRAEAYLGSNSTIISYGVDSAWQGKRLPKMVQSILLMREKSDATNVETVSLIYRFSNITICEKFGKGGQRQGL